MEKLRLSPLEEEAIRKVKEGKSACSSHLADMGLIPPNEARRIHEALRRVAKKEGVYFNPDGSFNPGWLSRLGKKLRENS